MLQKILILGVNFYKFIVSLWREFKVSILFFVNPIVRDSFFPLLQFQCNAEIKQPKRPSYFSVM